MGDRAADGGNRLARRSRIDGGRRTALRALGASLLLVPIGVGTAAATDGSSYGHRSRDDDDDDEYDEYEYGDDRRDRRFRSRRRRRRRARRRRRRRSSFRSDGRDVDVELDGRTSYIRYERSNGEVELDTDDVSIDIDDDVDVDVSGRCRVVRFESDGDGEIDLDLGNCGRFEVD
jgi:hypothetical protein